jgi:hypothetical protein
MACNKRLQPHACFSRVMAHNVHVCVHLPEDAPQWHGGSNNTSHACDATHLGRKSGAPCSLTPVLAGNQL